MDCEIQSAVEQIELFPYDSLFRQPWHVQGSEQYTPAAKHSQ